jgi:tRNA nucleotidyltransferase (CCA-adding enzyme)
VVLGRHLLARGFEPGPEIGRLLACCREVQDETGWSDETRILDRVLLEFR